MQFCRKENRCEALKTVNNRNENNELESNMRQYYKNGEE